MRIGLLLFNGIGLGLSAAAPIGPVNVEIARRTLRYRRAAGFAVGCGAVTVDVAYAVVTSLASVRILEYARLRSIIALVGGLFLGYLAFLCIRAGLKETSAAAAATVGEPACSAAPPEPAHVPAARLSVHYALGLLMTALNPMTLIFWFVGVPGAVAELTPSPAADLPLVCAGVFAGAFSWVCFFTWLIGHLGKFGRQRWLKWIDLSGGIMLLAFAIQAIWRVAASAL